MAAGQIFCGITVAVESEIFVGVDDGIGIGAFKVDTVIESRIGPHLEVGAFHDVDFRERQHFLFGENSTQFTGKIETHSGETLQKIVDRKNSGVMIMHGPAAALLDFIHRIALGIINTGNVNIFSHGTDIKSVADQFGRIKARLYSLGSQTETEVVFSRLRCCHHRDLRPQNFGKKCLQFRGGKLYDRRGIGLSQNDHVARLQLHDGFFADGDLFGEGRSAERKAGRSSDESCQKYFFHKSTFCFIF